MTQRSIAQRAVARARRSAQRRVLAALYARGRRRTSATETREPSLLRLGERLRAAAIDANRDRFSGTRWRFLLCTPPSAAAEVWFSDLESGMRHAGVPVRRLPVFAKVDAPLLDEFRPTVVVALDRDETLACIDLTALREHKREHGCLRLFVATRDDLFTAGTMSETETRRLERSVRGDGADAFVSLYEPECFPRLFPAWKDAGFRSISVPQSGNPLEDHPCDTAVVHDYFYVSVCTPERLSATWNELRPILWRHRGDWAGEGWGFGGRTVSYDQIPSRYGAARVALAPLLPRLRRDAFELTHRVYEAAACGAFQIATLSPITRRFFSERALVCGRDGADFVRLFEQFVGRADERNRYAEQGLIELYAGHTVFHRIEALLAALEPLDARA